MKKKLLTFLVAILCAVMCLTGCSLGTYIENGGKTPGGIGNVGTGDKTDPDNPDNPNEGDTPTDDLRTHYRVQLYYGNNPYYPGGEEIYVVWRNDDNIVRKEVNDKGEADAGELEGEYAVYLEGLPSKYTYDCNNVTATPADRNLQILLVDLMEPANATRANGKGLYTDLGCYSIVYDGTYRAVLDGSLMKIHPANGSDRIYQNGAMLYEYRPDKSGYYSITSKVSIYEDEINPYIDIYGGSLAYKWFTRTIDGGGKSLPGGFTKNFVYEVRIPQEEVGNTFTFAVYAATKTTEFPLYVDFEIKYIGEYQSAYTNVRVVRMEEDPWIANEPGINESFVWADFGTKIFDNDNYRYNNLTETYHYYNMDLYGDDHLGFGAGFGPQLMFAINVPIPSYSNKVMYNMDRVVNEGTGAASNFLMIPNIWFEDELAYGTLDYTAFVKTDYFGKCNAQGYCYVTKELKDFLTLYADKRSLYNDGKPDEGTPEANGYYAEEDALWLFACGFYYVGGVAALRSDLAQFN